MRVRWYRARGGGVRCVHQLVDALNAQEPLVCSMRVLRMACVRARFPPRSSDRDYSTDACHIAHNRRRAVTQQTNRSPHRRGVLGGERERLRHRQRGATQRSAHAVAALSAKSTISVPHRRCTPAADRGERGRLTTVYRARRRWRTTGNSLSCGCPALSNGSPMAAAAPSPRYAARAPGTVAAPAPPGRSWADRIGRRARLRRLSHTVETSARCPNCGLRP